MASSPHRLFLFPYHSSFWSLLAACGSGSRSSGATPVSGPPPPSASGTPAGQPTAVSRLQMQLHLRGLQNSASDLRGQLQQLRKLQVPNPPSPPPHLPLPKLCPTFPHHPTLAEWSPSCSVVFLLTLSPLPFLSLNLAPLTKPRPFIDPQSPPSLSLSHPSSLHYPLRLFQLLQAPASIFQQSPQLFLPEPGVAVLPCLADGPTCQEPGIAVPAPQEGLKACQVRLMSRDRLKGGGRELPSGPRVRSRPPTSFGLGTGTFIL